MWGQVSGGVIFLFTKRIIPTRVGTRMGNTGYSFGKQDHPHACGDKKSITIIKKKVRGSSPRVWGQVTRYLHMLKDSRIIPTRVGTRYSKPFHTVKYQDHPHACGDKNPERISICTARGSSPRVWGQGFLRQRL